MVGQKINRLDGIAEGKSGLLFQVFARQIIKPA